jgi:glucose/arabinose dehydrogenase
VFHSECIAVCVLIEFQYSPNLHVPMERFTNYLSARYRSLLILCWALFSTVGTFAQPDIQMRLKIDENLNVPMQLVNAGDGSGRIFIAEKSGVVQVFDANHQYLGIYLDIQDLVLSTEDEAGLLSIAFHPDFKNNGCFFVYYSDKDAQVGHVVVARYKTSTPSSNKMVDPAPVKVLVIDHAARNHYGGDMNFGQDGNLYLSVGDGGGSNDPNNNAQNTSSLLGKLLRITVATTGAATYTIPADNPFGNEVFAYGLRNPFRWCFDKANGNVWLGDVGQNGKEEINFQTAAQIKGSNFGWRCYEGDIPNPAFASAPECSLYGNLQPRYSYGRALGVSVMGGIVYRGQKYPDMAGYYIGSDYYTGLFHVIAPDTPNGTIETTSLAPLGGITDFGEAENGDIYAVASTRNSVYMFFDANVPLPVQLVKFSGVRGSEGVTLTWETSSEKDFQGFEVEYGRSPNRLVRIGTISAQQAAGGSLYRFVDPLAATDHVYYRLKMIDLDGTFAYSRIISVPQAMEERGFVYPSVISTGSMSLQLDQSYTTLELINLSGTTIMKSEITGKTGNMTIPVHSVASGLYIVRLTNPAGSLQQKVMIMP